MTNPTKERALDFRIFKDLDIPEMSIAAGQLVLAEGSTGSAMYIIRNGSVAVRVNGVTVEEIGEGGIFGEMAIIEQSTRSAEILALTDVTVVMLDEQKFLSGGQGAAFFRDGHAHPRPPHPQDERQELV